MQLVVPMAGLGHRFAEAGYALPKPLLPVGGMPMVMRAIADFPIATRTVFVVHPDHERDYFISGVLQTFHPKAIVVVAPKLTDGQASSVRLALPELDTDEDVLVAACDNTHMFNLQRWQNLAETRGVDCAIWVYRNDPRVLIKPTAHGWVETEAYGKVKRVSVKVPLSTNPLQDAAISGTFWFRTTEFLANSIDELIAQNDRVNNEFYLDSVPNILIAKGHDVRAFQVNKYIGWGTPQDYEDYNLWAQHFGEAKVPGAKCT